MARQDSGKLSRFKELYPSTPKLASEIESFKDVAAAGELGYVAAGAGGFFGEKRRTCTEFSLAMKLVKTMRADGSGGQLIGYAGKLGDADGGSWASYDAAAQGMPAKFIASVEAPRQRLWDKMLAYGQLGDAQHDKASKGEATTPLLRQADGFALADALSKLGASPCLSQPKYAEMAARLQGYAAKVLTATMKLPQ